MARKELVFFLVRTTMQPLLFLVVFGYLLPKMNFVGRGYQTALLPGILAVSLSLSAIQSVALPMVQDFGWTKEIEDRLLAPVPTRVVAAEKIVAGMLQGFIAAAFVLPIARLVMGPIAELTWTHAGVVILVVLLGSLAFSALGMWLGTAIAPQQIGLMFSVIIAPMIFFGCAYYPWRGLDAVPVMKYLVLANPMVYVSEGMRGALTPSVPHMPLPVVGVALARRDGGVLDARHSQLLQTSHRMTRGLGWALALVATLASSGQSQARGSSADIAGRHAGVAGVIHDTLGRPIRLATIFVDGSAVSAASDDSGRFVLRGLSAGRNGFTVTKIGYAPVSFETSLLSDSMIVLSIPMRSVQVMDPVKVSAARINAYLDRTGFQERKRVGLGTFLTPEKSTRWRPEWPLQRNCFAACAESMSAAPRAPASSSHTMRPVACGSSSTALRSVRSKSTPLD